MIIASADAVAGMLKDNEDLPAESFAERFRPISMTSPPSGARRFSRLASGQLKTTALRAPPLMRLALGL